MPDMPEAPAITTETLPQPTRLLRRVFALFWLKMLGSTVVISAFFVGYFYVLNHPLTEPFEMPLLALDRWTPVVPWSAWIYFSLWVYICMPSSLMRRANELGYYLMGAALLSMTGLLIFYCLPTVVPVWEIDWSVYPVLAFLKSSDASGNACPSLHVAFSVYAGFWLSRMLRVLGSGRGWFALNWFWCGLIVLSTMTTKQHVFLDVLCGGALGALVFWLNDRLHHVACELASRRTCGGERASAPACGRVSPESFPDPSRS